MTQTQDQEHDDEGAPSSPYRANATPTDQGIITCPSGMRGRIRPMTLKEAQFFADPKKIRTGESFEKLLQSCWVETVDPGPYPWLQAGNATGVGSSRPDWQKILIGDRFAAMVDIRMESLEDLYGFKMRCPDCDFQFTWELSLRDLKRKPLPQESREQMLAGDNRFTCSVGEHVVTYKLGTGAEEAELVKIRERIRHMGPVDMLRLQIIEVDGDATAKGVRQFCESLTLPQGRELTDAMQAADCGLETKIEIECPDCEWRFDVELPFGEGFFRMTTKKKPAATSSGA